MIGGLIASYVHISLLPEIVINASKTVSIQKDFLDKIFPNILPFTYTLLMYFFLKKKKMSPVVLIAATFGLAILLSFLGIL